jgi:hypothetical protein
VSIERVQHPDHGRTTPHVIKLRRLGRSHFEYEVAIQRRFGGNDLGTGCRIGGIRLGRRQSSPALNQDLMASGDQFFDRFRRSRHPDFAGARFGRNADTHD